ncbi:rod-binding protein [Yoonia sp. R2331]|uniref:rod-binding protein n=1 Tax=Yoonia sp. R2331 TaxID=3237238 RepID=UPI0034E573EA
MTPIPVLPAAVPPPIVGVSVHDEQLRAAAQKLEATFLAEMLKSAGLDAQSGAFGGGIGEEQFSSFLREAQAEEMVAAGGIGLAESLFNAMKARANG